MEPVESAFEKDKVYSVSELTSRVKQVIESEFPQVSVLGEVSNY